MKKEGKKMNSFFARNQIAELKAELAIYQGAELTNLDWLRLRNSELFAASLITQVRQRLTTSCGT